MEPGFLSYQGWVNAVAYHPLQHLRETLPTALGYESPLWPPNGWRGPPPADTNDNRTGLRFVGSPDNVSAGHLAYRRSLRRLTTSQVRKRSRYLAGDSAIQICQDDDGNALFGVVGHVR